MEKDQKDFAAKLKSLIKYLAITGGREKLCRLVQYFCRFLVTKYAQQYEIMVAQRSTLSAKKGRAEALMTGAAMTRKILRFGPSINCIKTIIFNLKIIASGKSSQPLQILILKTFSALFVGMFFICDHYLWLFKMGLVSNDSLRAQMQFWSSMGWFLDCITCIIKNGLISSKDKRPILQNPQLLIDTSYPTHSQNLEVLMVRQSVFQALQHHQLECISYGLDVYASYFDNLNINKFNRYIRKQQKLHFITLKFNLIKIILNRQCLLINNKYMGASFNCRTFCPGENSNIYLQETNGMGFSDQIQNIIDGIRQANRNQISNLKNLNLPQGKIYRGQLQNGKKSGYGQYYNGNNVYFGIFSNDLPEGQGLLVKDYKDYIKGYFSKGKPNGQVREKINMTSFHGQYFQGEKSRGILKTQNYTYQGSFKQNKFQGYGILEFTDGDRYEGDFKNGLFDGFGKYQTRQEGYYQGDFKKGLYHGKGIFRWRDDYFYDGQYKNGQRNGYGKFRKGKNQYKGFWIDGQPQNNSKFEESFNESKINSQKIKK